MKALVHSRFREVSLALLLAIGLIVLQTLIGGRYAVFAYTGYIVVGITGVLALVAWFQTEGRADATCLGTAAILFLYLLGRNFVPELPYCARADVYCVIAALVVYGLSATALSTSRSRLIVLTLLLSFALVHVVVGLMQFTRGDEFMPISAIQRPDYGLRASGLYGCPNHLAGLLEVLGVFGLSFALWSRWPLWAKLLIGYLAAACFAGVALTGSRGGYISTVTGVAILVLLSILVSRKTDGVTFLRQGVIGLVVIATVLTLGAALLYNSSFLQERAADIVDTKNIRPQLWQAAIEQWKLQPVFGTGGGTYRFYGRYFRSPGMQRDPVDVHNDYLHLLAEYGVVGFVAFLFFFGAHLRRGLKTFRHFCRGHHAHGGRPSSDRLALNIGALCALAAYVVHSVVDFNLHVPANALLMAFVMGILANPGLRGAVPTSNRFLIPFPRFAIGATSLCLLLQCGRLFPGEYFSERARLSLRNEDPISAIALAKKALTYDRGNPNLCFDYGRALLASGHLKSDADARDEDYIKAADAFLQGHTLAPLDGSYPLNAAFTFDQLNRFPEAEEMYGMARGCDPHGTAIAELYNFHLYQWRQKL